MALKHTFNFLLHHPLNENQKFNSIARFVLWQVKFRLNNNLQVAPFAEKSKIFVKRGLSGATGNLYSGLHEFEEMSFLLHFLRPTDLFVDLGANVGSYTILASNESEAESIAVEPIKEAFKILEDNIKLNKIQSLVKSMNIGLGNTSGPVKFTNLLDTNNHVAKSYDTETVNVQMERLDNIINLNKPTLIKMDVEGFESEVLKGMNNALENKCLKAMIIELNGSGLRYNFDEHSTHQILIKHGFQPYRYDPFYRMLTKLDKNGLFNTIYIRDFDFVNDRVKSSRIFEIRGHKL